MSSYTEKNQLYKLQKQRMSCHQLNLIIIFMWELVYFSGIVSEKVCDLRDLFVCLESETCEQKINSTSEGICKCKKGFRRISPSDLCTPSNNEDQVLPTPESVYFHGSSVSAIAVGILVPLFIILAAGSLIYAAKKYRWLPRVREHAHQLRARHYDTVLVNREDDPPLA